MALNGLVDGGSLRTYSVGLRFVLVVRLQWSVRLRGLPLSGGHADTGSA
ncbi:predicted protein [Streptomyces viridosporus ATCC 14672]|uniref:Predicted protein n=1 Tax=Streptomyces viridosporus (strain ATCC 14672 / DSM 40746 / JCM 4963 / KCTC 9882 / NRRL B-12104 / FH 1290) TaxID=566461 RepID=D5ZQG6_STRV1|nr:predicted protein [Streptomyces viridosporus ATCC 14672]